MERKDSVYPSLTRHARRPLRRSANDARGLLPHGQRHRRSASASTAWFSSRCEWPGNPARAARRHESRQVLLRGHRPRLEPGPLLARVRFHLRRVGDDGRGEEAERGRSTSRCAFPAPERPCADRLKKRDAQNAFREVWSLAVDPEGHVRGRLRSRRRPGRSCAIEKNGEPGREGGLPDPGRRLHGGRARQVREGRAAPGGDPLRRFAVQGAPRRLQRLGPVPARRRSRASRALRPASTAAPASARPTTRSARSATS